MCARFAGANLIAGPLVCTSLCGITSLFVTASQPPRRSVTTWLALNEPPLTDHVWHPSIWWRMRREAWPGVEAAEAAPAATTAAIAAAKTREVRLRIIGTPFEFSRCDDYRVAAVVSSPASDTSAWNPVGTASTGQTPECRRPWVTLPRRRPATRP